MKKKDTSVKGSRRAEARAPAQRRRRETQKTLSLFYKNRLPSNLNTSDQVLVFKWLQQLQHQQTRGQTCLFNVQNDHQCLREEPIQVVQPFQTFDEFYGCLICGKYHICRQRQDTCDVIRDPVSNQKCCAYTGRLLKEQNNCEIGSTLECIRNDKEACRDPIQRYQQHHMNNEHRRLLRVREPVAQTMALKNRCPSQQQETSDSDDEQFYGHPTTTTTNTAEKEWINHVLGVEKKETGGGDESVEVMEEEAVAESDAAKEECSDIEAWGNWVDEMVTSILPVSFVYEPESKSTMAADACRENEVGDIDLDTREGDRGDEYDKFKIFGEQTFQEADFMSTICSSSFTDYDEDDAFALSSMTVDTDEDTGTHNKNYHNNLAYWNHYFRFLDDAEFVTRACSGDSLFRAAAAGGKVHGDASVSQKPRSVATENIEEIYDSYKRDIRAMRMQMERPLPQSEAGGENKESPPRQQQQQVTQCRAKTDRFSASLLSLNARNTIRNTTNELVWLMYTKQQQTSRQSTRHSTREYTQAVEKIVDYYVPLIINITHLVYQSPVLDEQTLKRTSKIKNQKKITRASASVAIDDKAQLQSDQHYHEHSVSPDKICVALLLNLFLEPLTFPDAFDCMIEVWNRDAWLTTLYKQDIVPMGVIGDHSDDPSLFHIIHQSKKTPILRKLNRKKLLEISYLVKRCLTSYNAGPQWLRAMIFDLC